MKRLYQWFSERASFFHSDTTGRSTTRTVRTEVTVHQEGMTLVVGGLGTVFDICPFCQQKLASTQAEAQDFAFKKVRPTEIATKQFQYKLSPKKHRESK